MSGKLNIFRIALTLIFTIIVGTVSAQTVKGNVKDTNGEAVIGATITEVGTKNMAVTDFDGNFTIKTSGKKQLSISYIGMKTKTVNIGGKSSVNVVLEEDNTTLNDVVVIGYGSVKKKDLTGSVATVNSETLAAVPVANASEALTGKMAGVQVTTTEGSPDAEVKIRVRGGGSITQSNDPLYIVDGFPVETISDIPASEIEDITVLKDASSTAIYGSRGANGVILVTTKSGKEGKVSVSYNAYYSWKKIAKKMDVLSAKDYATWQYELAMLKNDGDVSKISSYTDYFGNYQDLDLYDNVATNDWQDVVFGRTGHTFNHSLNVTGGSDNIKYAFNYAHMNDKAIMLGSSYKRDNFSLKLNTKPTKRTTLDFSARYAITNVRGGGANEASSTLSSDKRLKYSVIYTPIPLSNLDATAGSDDDDLGNLYNPVQSVYDNDRKKIQKNLNLNGSFGWEIIDNLKAKIEFGYQDYSLDDQRFYGLTTYRVRETVPEDYKNMPATTIKNTFRHQFRSTNTVSYDFKKLLKSKDHSLNVMVGHEYVIKKQNTDEDEVVGFPVDYTSDKAWKLASQGTANTIVNTYDPDDKLLSYFGRVNYNFQDKYLLSGTFRADASSKFNSNNRWGYFPSAAIAWRISSEKFMEKTKGWLDDLKLRFSYGTAGNNNIPSGQLVLAYEAITPSTETINWVTNYLGPQKTDGKTYMPNPDLKWETTITRNLGLDFTLFGGKLNGSVEGYINTTKDLLIRFAMTGTGYDYQYRNMGKTENKGLEFTFTYHAINKKNFGLDFSGNIGFNKTKIKDIGTMTEFSTDSKWASTEIQQDYRIMVGGAVGEIYGYQLDGTGRYEVSDFQGYDETTKKWILKDGVASATSVVSSKLRPGTLKLKDQATEAITDENGNITGYEGNGTIGTEDMVKIGDTNPDAQGGFSINARAYGFDLSANFNYKIGGDVYNANKIEYTSTSKYQYRNMTTEMESGKRWTNINAAGELVNDPTELAALNANTTMWSPYTDRFILTDWAIEDASFLRLNTLTLGYTFPDKLMKKIGVKSLRLYATMYNVFTITGYSGFDPEADCIRITGQTTLTPNVDYSGYPRSRQYVIGLNLNF